MTQVSQSERVRRRVESGVRRFMEEHCLFPADGRLLVAVSGGPDSTALLLILSRLAQRWPLQLTAAYFDHQLRGEAAAKAENDAVETLAQALGVPLIKGGGDVRSESKRLKLSLEDAARRARYGFLASAARDTGCAYVTTGHTASDQAETVLLHLVRGAGLAGLAGMAPRSAWPSAGGDGLSLVRPLLALGHDEAAAYCHAAGVEPIDDESNRSLDYQRNRVRHALLPQLRRFNPRVEAALVRLAASARDDVAYIEAIATAAMSSDESGVSLERRLLAGWPASPRRHALRLGLVRLGGEGVSERHLRALERLVRDGRTGDRLDLPQAVTAELRRDALVLYQGALAATALPEGDACLVVPGETRFGPLIVAAGESAPATGAVSVAVAAAALGDAVVVRRRRPGDRIEPAGLGGTKKLQDLFVDAHVPRAERDSVPIFENDRGILWVGGLRVADWARPIEGRPTVYLSYRRL